MANNLGAVGEAPKAAGKSVSGTPAKLVSRDGKQSSTNLGDDSVLLGNLIAFYLKGDWSYDEGLKIARYYAPNRMTDEQIRRAVLHAAKLQKRQLSLPAAASENAPRAAAASENAPRAAAASENAPRAAAAPKNAPRAAAAPKNAPRAAAAPKNAPRAAAAPKNAPRAAAASENAPQPLTQQSPDNRVWLANVFQRIYGAGFNQPNGYQYAVSEEKDDSGNIVRSIRIFRADDANAPSYVFKAQPDKTWTLYSGDGKELIRNVYYDPKTKRFFVAGVSEDDVLKTLQPLQQQNQTPQQSSNAPQPMIPGAVWFQMLDDNTAVAKTIDKKIRILRNAGNNQWIILREMDYDEFINPTGGGAPVGQTTPNTTNDQEQGMNWLYLMLPLLAIILSRR